MPFASSNQKSVALIFDQICKMSGLALSIPPHPPFPSAQKAFASLGNRTIYYHFKSKDEIITAVMGVQHLHLLAQYQTWLEPNANTPREIVISLFAKLKNWADSPDWLGSGFSRVSAELADMRGHPARLAASRHKKAVEIWLADSFKAAGVTAADDLAREIMLLIEGSMGLALIHGETAYIDAAMHAAERLVTEV